MVPVAVCVRAKPRVMTWIFGGAGALGVSVRNRKSDIMVISQIDSSFSSFNSNYFLLYRNQDSLQLLESSKLLICDIKLFILLTGLSGGGAGLRTDPDDTVVDLKCIGLGVGVGFPDSVKSGVDLAINRDLGSVVDEIVEAILSKSLSLSMIDLTIANFFDLYLKSAADFS